MNPSLSLAGIGMTSRRTRARMIDRLRARGIADETVLAAMNAVPRHIFVEEALSSHAYDDMALPLGFGLNQTTTISQPYIVARMLEILLNGRRSPGKTLEVGAGCGYQSAVLGHLSRDVYAVERIEPLLARARRNLAQLPDIRVHLKHADGGLGLPEAVPFDSIIVSAAATAVPQDLLRQLAPDGILVLPVGGSEQYLYRIERTSQGFVETRLESVRFVPLLVGLA
ncbi:MAG: protein-L-isoaspartate(D-aspartate) O-methyltransferase [Zoogloeaceae bacterium]|jgi:protein-L-isoaspartate(D-aspartate) O-methyltransferase|nr:protein-L-isoaspartate(D-aspartate) O-methyltransferase [Zoogloeaceae bacterium]